MKATIERRGLLAAVRGAAEGCARSDVSPALMDVLIEAHESGLTVTGMDLQLCVRTEAASPGVSEPGRVLACPKPLMEILRGSNVESVTLESEGDALHLTAGSSRFKLLAGSADDFPDYPELPESWAEVEAASLVAMANRVLYAVARERQRYALNGALLILDGAKGSLAATDGRRLAVAEVELDPQVKPAQSAIVEPRMFAVLAGMKCEEGDFAGVAMDESRVFFRVPGAVILGQIIEGKFPPYAEVIPADPAAHTLTMGRAELASALRLAAVMTARSTRTVTMRFDKKGMTSLEATDPEHGEAHVEPTGSFTGKPLTMRLNPDFLLDALSGCEGEEVTVEMWSARQPLVIREAGMTALMMPVTDEG